MSDFAAQPYALHHQVSVWPSARMCVPTHEADTLCACALSLVCTCVSVCAVTLEQCLC